MKKHILLILLSLFTTFFLFPFLGLSVRFEAGLLNMSGLFFVLGFGLTYIKNISTLYKMCIIIIPVWLFIFAGYVIDYFYKEADLVLTSTLEYIPVSVLMFWLGTIFKEYLDKKKYYRLLSIGIFLVIYFFSISYFMYDYYYHLYTKQAINVKNIPTEFSFTKLDGSTLTEKDLLGKVLVLDFWSSNCGSCISQIEELNYIKKEYKNNKNIVFLAINPAISDTYQKFETSRHVKLFSDSTTFVYDKDKIFATILKITGVPKIYIINHKGKVVTHINGFWNDKVFRLKIKQEIDKLLR